MDFKLISPMRGCSALEQIFYNRGFKNANDIKHYLNTSDKDMFNSASIDRIKDGSRMLISHIAQNHDIFIQVDSDADGMTSSAILINYLYCLFPTFAENHIKYWVHEGKGHGIDIDAIGINIKLVIAPDSSSSEFDKHEELAKRGIDVLVIDHHNAEKISEFACVINNQLCDYPTKVLSGAGMVYKFCDYIDSLLNENFADQYLDLAALGCIADVMDLRDFELRHLITKVTANVRNPYIKAMIAKNDYNIQGNITPHNLAFYVAPQLNSITRVGTVEEKRLVFESMLESMAYENIPSTKRGAFGQMETRVEQAVRTCTNVKNKQDKVRDSFSDKIDKIIETDNLLKNKILVVRIEEKDDSFKNITGLIANKIMSKYQRPVLILNKVFDDDGKLHWAGSARNYPGTELTDLQAFLLETELVDYAQGHSNAFGVSILDENIENFIAITNEKLKDIEFIVRYDVDMIYDPINIDINDILSIADSDYLWGQGIDEPLIAITNIHVNKDNLQLLGTSTLKITLGNNLTLIKFKVSEDEYNQLYSSSGCVTIDVVGTCKRNVKWDGGPQIMIKDYNVKERKQWYF